MKYSITSITFPGKVVSGGLAPHDLKMFVTNSFTIAISSSIRNLRSTQTAVFTPGRTSTNTHLGFSLNRSTFIGLVAHLMSIDIVVVK